MQKNHINNKKLKFRVLKNVIKIKEKRTRSKSFFVDKNRKKVELENKNF